MALKLKIDKATFDTLSDTVKEQYKANATNAEEFNLDLDGYEDPAELRRAKDREKLEAATQKKRADDLQAELDGDKERKSKNRGDIDALEKSWKDKRDADVKKESDKSDKYRKQVEKLLVDNVALATAQKISLSPTLIAKVIRERLIVDFEADEPTTRVLGTDGKLSALSLADLEKEIIDTKEYAPIIRGSNASGGGAAGNQGGGAAKAFKDMGDKERTELYRTDPARFAREDAANKAANTAT